MKTILSRLILAASVLSAVGVTAACTNDSSESQRATGSIEIIGHVDSALSSADVARIDISVSGLDAPYTKQLSLTKTNGQWSGELDGLPTGHYNFVGSAWDQTTGGNQLYGAIASGVYIPVGQTALLALSFHPSAPPTGFSNNAPLIQSMTATRATVAPGATITIGATATDPDVGDAIHFQWNGGTGISSGEVDGPTSSSIQWTAPSTLGQQTVSVYVSDTKGATSLAAITIDVANPQPTTGNVSVTTTFLAPATISAMTVDNAQPKPGQSVAVIAQVVGGNPQCPQQDGFCSTFAPPSSTWTTDCPVTSQTSSTSFWTPATGSASFGLNLASQFGALTSCSVTATFTDAAGLVATGTVKLQLTQPTTTYDQ